MMTFNSFAKKIIAKQGHLIHKIVATDSTGRRAYYFVLINEQNKISFEKKLAESKGQLNLNQYGEIIASCYGEEPTEEIRKFLKKEYGFII